MSMGHVIAPADQEDFLVAVFVCVFDHRKGNLLVFKEPNDVELTDVEFKAMPGGSHHVSEDRVLFEMGGFYGAASYNLQRDPSAPRGLRAASVGLIGANFETLQHHFDFLLQQAKLVNEAEEPSAFDTRRLSEHFAQHCHSPALRPPRELAVGSDGHAKVMAPQGSFLDLLARFEARVFVLWRFVMLRKRLVLLAAPPVGPACDMVAALCQLQVDTARIVMPGHDESMAPLFFVPLNSWQSVEGVSSYAACVTERIVEQKPKLHDAFIKGSNISTTAQFYNLMELSTSDQRRWDSLQQLMLQHKTPDRQESLALSFFVAFNNSVLQALASVANSANPTLSSTHVQSIGLDPYLDNQFLKELALRVFPDVSIESPGCCGCC
eukprot:m.67687 g.67687  ORF g.67687 m.67687 type:complete len:380 (+) comp13845_c0_seq2:152-1291(+)